MTDDPFGTDALRRAVTEAWRASPTRFREDANSEEDHARGYYRDRVVVELAQNAADAAARAGVVGRLTLRLERRTAEGGEDPAGAADVQDWWLVAANTGAPLDAAGVASLASLRASAKVGHLDGVGDAAEVVGRFGVGFAAVRSVSDEIVVRSRAGGVRFSLAKIRAEIRLGASVAARGDALPVLRLPFPAPGTAPDELDTVVEIRLRDAESRTAVREQLAALDDALLLALPALDEIVIDAVPTGPAPTGPAPSRVLRDVGSRWRVHRASGRLEPDSSLPSEARRSHWSVLWALPLTERRPGTQAPETLHAPTPTDVRLTFPALLIGSFPVDPGRRGVLPGPTTDQVAAAAGRAYAELLGELAAGHEAAARDVLALVPTGLPASDTDATIRSAVVEALRDTRLLGPPSSAPYPAPRTAPRDAAFLAGPLGEDLALAEALAPCTPAVLVAVPVRHQMLVRSLGATAVDLAELVEALPAEPRAVRAVLDALAPYAGDPAVLEAVAGAQLPLADGRTTRGARGTVLLDAPHLTVIARTLGVRVIHHEAAHPVLERAGAAPTTASGLLADPGVRSAGLAAAQEMLDGGDADHLGVVLTAASPDLVSPDVEPDVEASTAGAARTLAAVLELVRLAVAGPGTAELPFWLGELPVVADDDIVPLRETVLPGTWAAQHLDLSVVRGDVVGRQGAAALTAAGARAEPVVYRIADVVASDGSDTDADYGPDDPAGWLSDWDDYLDHLADELGAAAWIGDVEAVPDLDALRDVAGPDTTAEPVPLAAVLARLADDRDLRRALLDPVRSPDAPGREALSYTAWFLRRRLGAPFALGDVPLLPTAPAQTAGLDADVLRVLGGFDDLADLPGRYWPVVMERLPDSAGNQAGQLSADAARAVWAGLAALARDGEALASVPAQLPALGPAGITVERTDDLAVAPTSRWAQLGPVVPASADVAAALADLLDLPLEGAAELAPDGQGTPVGLDHRVVALAPGAPATWCRHDVLTVEGTRVDWWVSDGRSGDAVAHAVSTEGLARALAELTGVDALLLEAVLRDPARAEVLIAEGAWD